MHQKRTGDVPQALRNKPDDPPPDVEFLLHAFFFLSGFRGSNGFGMNPIPYLASADYADRVGYSDPVDFFPFMEAMQALDREYLRHLSDKQDREAKLKSKQPAGRRGR